MATEPTTRDRLEPDSTNARLLLAVAGSVIALLVVAFGATLWFYEAEVPEHGAIIPAKFPAPGLSGDQALERRQLTAEQNALLQSYRWIDREHGIISVPIDDAMRRIAAKGAQGYAPIVTAPPATGGGQ